MLSPGVWECAWMTARKWSSDQETSCPGGITPTSPGPNSTSEPSSARMGARRSEGRGVEVRPGDVGVIPPGHDAWIVGNESFVGIDFQGGAVYAKPRE